MEGKFPANSKAVDETFIVSKCSYPELCVVKKKETYSGTGYEDGQYPFVLYNRAVLRHKTKTKLLIFDF